MPAKPSWFPRLPEILQALRALPAPLLDRTVVERLFGVRRRRAHHLMSRFGGIQVGRTFLVERLEVIGALESTLADGDYVYEARRKRRLALVLEEAGRELAARKVVIRTEGRAKAGFPPGVEVHADELRIRFSGAPQLLDRLLGLAQAAAQDYQAFERTVTRIPSAASPTEDSRPDY